MSGPLLILAPRGRDAAVAAGLFERFGIDAQVCGDIPALIEAIELDAEAVMLTEEVLASPDAGGLADWIAAQPDWSDLPFIVLANGHRGPRGKQALQRLKSLGNVVLLERPLHAEAMLGAVQSAFNARSRQYQVRDSVAKLLDSERELRFTLKAGRLGAWTLDLISGELTTSETCRTNFGRDPAEPFSYEELKEAVHPDDKARMVLAVEESVASGADYDIEYRILTPGGDVRWVQIRAQPTFGDDGAPDKMTGVSVDVTNRKRDDASQAAIVALGDAIREARDTDELAYAAAGILGHALGVGRVGYGTVDAATETVVVHRDWTAPGIGSIAGLHRFRDYGSFIEDLTRGQTVVLTDATVDLRTAPAASALLDLNIRSLVNLPITEQGILVALMFVNHATARDWNDRDLGLIREFAERLRTATERKLAEARLQALNETLERQVAERTDELRQFRDIVEATTSPICAFDRDFRLIAFNRAHNVEFRRVNGFDTKIGDVFPDLFVAEQQPLMRALMARALSGEAFTVTEEFGRPELGIPCWEITYTPLRDAEGNIIGAFHLATDISERLRGEAELALAQDALRQSQKMEAMGSLTGGVAHDFNNLLTPIVGSLDLLLRKGVGNEREQRLIAGAAQSAERARMLVQRLLAFARRQPLQATAVDLAPLVHGMADLVGSTTGPQIRVVVDAASGLPPAKVDPNQLEMAILNLAVNARDAMPAGGTLRISVNAETVGFANAAGVLPGTYLRVSVADTGTGMDDATIKRAIEPFFSTKGVGKGTGLGLSMAHGLASQLGGALTIASTPGVGTNIELWLPRSADALSAIETVLPPLTTAKGSGIALLVDDEELVRLSTADMLADLGYTVVEAGSAEEALGLVENGLEPDVVITDHLMPGITGTELARILQGNKPRTKVLIVSGYAEAEGIEPDLPRLTKPFRNADLADSLAALETIGGRSHLAPQPHLSGM